MSITTHCLVKNEDCWIWYALQSVLPFVDKVLLFDTGSTDQTAQIINNIKSPKIYFEEKGAVDRKDLIALRNEQIKQTHTAWLMILDGDEVWPQDQLQKLIKASQQVPKSIKALVNRSRNCVGDIYHYLPDESGRYELAGQKGHLNMRMIRVTQGLQVRGEYPLESYSDDQGAIAQQDKSLQFVDCWYLHTTYLQRSSTDKSKASGSLGKRKLPEQGIKLEENKIPEVLSLKRPEIVPDPFKKRGLWYESAAMITTPILKLKRKR